jgi:hypothetical protein
MFSGSLFKYYNKAHKHRQADFKFTIRLEEIFERLKEFALPRQWDIVDKRDLTPCQRKNVTGLFRFEVYFLV